MCVDNTSRGLLCSRECCPIKYLSVRVYSAAQCIYVLTSVSSYQFGRLRRLYGQVKENISKPQIEKIFPRHTVRPLFPGSIPLALHYCTLSAVWKSTSKLYHHAFFHTVQASSQLLKVPDLFWDIVVKHFGRCNIFFFFVESA